MDSPELIYVTYSDFKNSSELIMKKLFTILLLSVFVSGCNDQHQSHLSEKIIHLDFNPKDQLPKSLFKEINFIPLETTGENTIGAIGKLILSEDRMYIMDGAYAKKLFVFDTTGKYLFSVGTKGQGPGEYREIRDFTLYKKEIIILSFKEALFYNQDGKFLFKRDFNWMAENIIVKNNKEVYLFQNSNLNKVEFVPYHVIKTDLLFKNADLYLVPIKKEFYKPNRFQIYHDTVLLSAPQHFVNVINNVDNKNVSPYITLIFNNFEIPDNLGELTLKDDLKDYPILHNSYINENAIFFNFSFNNQVFLGIFNKTSGNFYSGCRLEESFIPIPVINEIVENKIYTSIDSYSLKMILNYYLKLKKEIDSDYRQELESLYRKLSEQSNPIIIRFSLI
jgi:hypothetical protein